MTEEEKKRLREALAGAKNAGSWKTPVVSAPKQTASVSSDRQRRPAEAPKVASVGGIGEGSEYNRGSVSELRKNYAAAPKAAETKVAAVGDSAFAGLTGFNKGLTGVLGAAADLVDPIYRSITESKVYQKAPAVLQRYIDNRTGRTVQQAAKGIADYYKKSDDEAQAQVARNIEAGQMGEIGNALIQGTVQAVPSVAAAWMGAGIPAASQSLAGTVNGAKTTAQMMGSVVKEMASKPQFILSAAQSFGGAYDEALAKGADTGEAITAAVLTAFPEAMIESMGGTEKLVEKIAGKAGKKGVKGAVQDILRNMAEESLEELVQYPVGKMAAMGYDPDMKLYSTTEEAVINPVEMGKAAAMGAAIGGIMGGGAKVGDVVVGKTVGSVGDMVWAERLGKEIREQDGGTALIRAAMESGDQKLQTEAERLTGKLRSGEQMTNRELADLYQAEVEAGIDTYTEEAIVKRAMMQRDLQTEKDPATVAGMEETRRQEQELAEYQRQIDEVFSGIKPDKDFIEVGSTPKILQQYGANPLKMTMTASVARKIAYPEGYFGGKHNLGIPALKHLSEQLNDPIAILKSKSPHNQKTTDGSLIVLTEWRDAFGKDVIVPIHLDRQGNIELENRIASAYGSSSLENLYGGEENSEYVLYTKNNEDIASLLAVRLQLPETRTEDTLIAHSIPQEGAESQGTQAANAAASSFGSTVPTQVVNRVTGGVMPEQDYETRQSLKKAADERHKAGTALLHTMYRSMGIARNADAREALRSVAKQAEAEIGETGTVSRATADRLFKEMWERGSILQDEYYQQYKGLKDDLRQTAVSISETDARNIPDFGKWKQQNRGRVTVTGKGMPVNRRYAELSKIHPELFPDDITHPADQLRQMAEVAEGIAPVRLTLDEGGEDVLWGMQQQFDEALGEFERRIRQTNSYEQRFLEQHQPVPVPDQGTLRQTWEALDAAEARRKAVEEKYGLLTDQDKTDAADVAAGRRSVESIIGDAREGILALAEAERDVQAAERVIGAYKREISAQKQEVMEELLATSDGWVDKKNGMAYHMETMERNFRDVAKHAEGGREAAEQLISTIFTPIHQNEAGRQKMIRQYKQQIAGLGLTSEESAWVQMVGEGVRDIEALPQKMDKAKIGHAVTVMRDQIYPDLLNQVNEVLLRNGYRPVHGRENYFPHFQDEGDPLVKAFKLLGMRIQTDALPTDIAGLTETFRPGKQYSGHMEQRVGEKTRYDALEGFDRYIESISNVIWHTDDIQNLRSLETALRRKYSDEGLQERVNAVNNDSTIDDSERAERLRELLDPDAQTKLGNLAIEIRSYTDSLAGKKAIGDRGMEQDIGRKWYSISKALEGRVAANMVALNPASWATNVIPILQASAEVDGVHLVKAMGKVLKAKGSDDGFADRSAFLTNRKSTGNLSATTLEKVTDKLSKPMEFIDNFTAETIVRAFYDQNIRDGMDPESAMESADQRAAGLMADRSKGALPTIFERKNPLIKTLTMFQTEVNNQFRWAFKDLPERYKKVGAAQTALLIGESVLASYLYNNLYEALIGRRPAFDPLGMVFEAVGNFIEKDEEGEKKKSTAQAIIDTGEMLLEQVPFVGGLMGGGRVPISSALPSPEKLIKGFGGLADGTMAPNAAWGMIGKEMLKPAVYLVPPVGGGQIKKSVEGVRTWAQGGSYTTKSDGSREMQYPVEQSVGNLLKMAAFGKSSVPQANEYYDGFKKTTELGDGNLLAQWFPDLSGAESRDTVAEDLAAKDTPRIVDWNITDEDGVKTEKSVSLSRKEQKQYQTYYAEYLADGIGEMDESQVKKAREYAREMSTARILSDVGEEYEVKAWVKEAAEAAEAGVDIRQYIGLQEVFSEIAPDKDEDGKTTVTAVEKKRAALMEREDLTVEQKNLIDRLLIQDGDNIKDVDYSSAASLQYTTLDKGERTRVDSIRTAFPGMSVDSVDKYRTICKSGSKREKLSALQAEGMSERDAVLFYRLAETAADKVDLSSREAAIRSTMDADEKVRAAAAAYAVKGITEEQYLVYTALLDGSDEENRAALVEQGLSESQAAKLLKVTKLSERDKVTSWNDVVYATMTDSQRTKLAQLQEYYPKATAADFDVCYQIYQSTKADKNSQGKTISGSKKKKVIAKLMEKGLGYQAALTFYNLMG